MRFLRSIALATTILISAASLSDRAAAQDFYAKYCLKCHGEDPDDIEGDTDLRAFEYHTSREFWRVMIEQIDSEEMPTKAPYPTRAERDAAIAELRQSLAKLPEPEVPTVRRLTRTEYRNTMRDLLGVDLKAGSSLPIDGQGRSGFSNDTESLTITPGQMELLFAAAENALDGAFAIAMNDEKSREFVATEMTPSSPGVKPNLNGMMVVQPTHFLQAEVDFPVDGYYEFSVTGGKIGNAVVARFYAAGEVVAEVDIEHTNLKTPETVSVIGFVKKGRHAVKIGSRDLVPQTPEPPNLVQIADDRGRQRAANLGKLPNESAPVAELRAALNEKAYGMQESIEFLRVFGPNGDSRKIDLHRKYYHERQDDWSRILEQLALETGMAKGELTRRWAGENAERIADNETILRAVADVEWQDWMQHQGKLYVEKVAVSGPMAPEHRAQSDGWNLIKTLSTPIEPVELVRQFAEEAFRRPVSDDELAPYTRVVLEAQRREEDRVRSIKLALAAILISPDFLFRGNEPGNYGLASDLSYFLWLSKPDAELVAADLTDPASISEQVTRLISDPRSEAFFEAFTEEWLELGEIAPDRSRWPEFSSEIAEAMRSEVHKFVATLVRENKPVAHLLQGRREASPTLTGFYENGPAGSRSDQDIGLLGKGAVLVATSSPTRTNPVRRGKWVWENLLGKSVGEPLPNAGELPGDAGEARGRALREEIAEHSSSAECARCHDKIDPIGFGLQNFDATGRWRELEAGRPVDAGGSLYGGGDFTGAMELRTLLLDKHGNDIARNFATRLSAFFSGREAHSSAEIGEFNADSGLREVLTAVTIQQLKDREQDRNP